MIHHRIGPVLTLALSLLGAAAAGCGSSSEEETLSAGETQAIAGTDRQFGCTNGQRVFVWTRNSDSPASPFVTITARDAGACVTAAGATDAGVSFGDAEPPDVNAGDSAGTP